MLDFQAFRWSPLREYEPPAAKGLFQRMHIVNPFCRPMGQPLIYGHRGARGVLPENTMVSFDYLRSLGVQAVEIDVQITADTVAVVIHDPHVPMQLARDAQGDWLSEPGARVIDLTAAELRSYDVGRLNPAHPYGARYPEQRAADGAKVPFLSEFLDWAAQDAGTVLNIEIKSFADRNDLGAAPEALVMALMHDLSGRGLEPRCLVSSFDWRVLRLLRDIAPGIARGYLSDEKPGPDCTIFDGSPWMDGLHLSDYGGSLPRLIAAQGAHVWCACFHDLTQERVAEAHDLGLAVNVWTVNDPADILAVLRMGVDGIITDYPERGLACLGPLST